MSDQGSSFRSTGPRYAPVTPQTPEMKLRDVSKAYEKLFLQQMMKSMRASVQESGFLKANGAERIFREELDAEYLQSWSDQGGVGFSEVIYNHLVEKFGPRLGLKTVEAKPQGPVLLNEKSNFNGVTKVPTPSPQEMALRFDFDSSKNSVGPQELTAPWSGSVLGKMDLADGSQYLEIRHENGLKSRISFRGQAERLNLGQSVQAGEKIGLLSPDAKAVVWTLGEDGANPFGSGSTVSE